MPKASAADTSASSRLSVSSCQMMRRRDAPIASRMPISRWRATARASSRLATFAHPIIRMRPNAKKSGVNSSMTSADSGTVPCLGSSTRLAAGRSTGTFSRTPRVPHDAAARAPVRATDRASAARRCRGRRSLRVLHGRGGTGRGARAAPRSPARRRSSPRKPSGITPTTWNRAPFTRTVRSSTPGSLAKCRDQARWLRTMTGRPPGSSSDGVSVRPRAALTPRTWKKLPVTSEPSILRPSIRLSMSGVVANASENTPVSRTSASYCARVKPLGLRVRPIADVRPRTARAGCAPRPRERSPR